MKTSTNIDQYVRTARGFRVLMMTTIDHAGRLDGRPMTLLAVEDDGTLWFAAPSDSPVPDKFKHAAPVSLCGQQTTSYLHVNGIAKAVQDEEQARTVWSETLRPWFPDGPESDDLILIQVTPQHASVWDSGIANAISFAWKTVKAAVTGEKVDDLQGRTFIDMTENSAQA